MGTDFINTDLASPLQELEIALFGHSLEELKILLAYDSRLKILWACIETSYSDTDFNLTQASKACGMSKTNLNVVMKRITGGYTCGELITAYRVYRSILVLLGQNASFTEVAIDCGFESSSSYSRAVKRLLRQPPSLLLPRSGKFRRVLELSPSRDIRLRA